MSDEIPTISPEAQTAVDSFDLVDWLNDAVNAESEITVYRDGIALMTLGELVELADEASDKAEKANLAELSIADDFTEAGRDAVQAVEAQREVLKKSALTFQLRSIGSVARDALLKKMEREDRFKAVPATDDEPAVPGRRQHPEFLFSFQKELLSRSIVSATDVQGRVNRGPWTLEIVDSLNEKLPLNEFSRLLNKAHELHFTQYEIDKLIDLDFSSRL